MIELQSNVSGVKSWEGTSALSCRCGSGVDLALFREHAWSACAVPTPFRPEHVPTAELSTELCMNRLAADTATDRMPSRSARTLCRQRRRVRRRAEKGACFRRPNQLGKIDLGGTRLEEMMVCTRFVAAQWGQIAAPRFRVDALLCSPRGVLSTPAFAALRRSASDG